MKCKDPCPGSCGQNAVCTVFNHFPACTCTQGYTGDPFTRCVVIEQINGRYPNTNIYIVFYTCLPDVHLTNII